MPARPAACRRHHYFQRAIYWPLNTLFVTQEVYSERSTPDLGNCCRCKFMVTGLVRIFFVHGTVPARRHSHEAVRILAGVFLSRRDLPSMTDYRVRHLVAD